MAPGAPWATGAARCLSMMATVRSRITAGQVDHETTVRRKGWTEVTGGGDV
jgi:hypothetical protein